MFTVKSTSFKQTEKIGESFSKTLKGTEIIAFNGDLGAGKTTFVRGMAKGLNILDNVSSPTFALVNEYKGNFNVYHFDMYRINNEDELLEIGWEDYLDRGGVIAVEWSENIEKFLNEKLIKIKIIRKKLENERILEFYNSNLFKINS